MERLHVLACSGLVLVVALACKQKKGDDDPTTTTTAPVETTSATAAPTESTTASISASAAATAPAPTAAVKLENCGQRYAAPARLDGKCADYCGGDYKCGPDETCTPTSWEPKTGPRNTKVCAPKGVKVRAPIPGAPWDIDGPAQESASAAPTASVAAGDKNGEVDDDKGKCPAGWVMAEEACHRPCTKDSECNPPKSFCKKWEGKKLCAFTGSLVVPND